MKYALLLVSLLMAACSSTERAVVTTHTVQVPVPAIMDTLPVVANWDSVFYVWMHGNPVPIHDTTITFQSVDSSKGKRDTTRVAVHVQNGKPISARIYVPPTLRSYSYPDTTRTIIESLSWWEKWKYGFIAIGMFCVGIVLIAVGLKLSPSLTKFIP